MFGKKKKKPETSRPAKFNQGKYCRWTFLSALQLVVSNTVCLATFRRAAIMLVLKQTGLLCYGINNL